MEPTWTTPAVAPAVNVRCARCGDSLESDNRFCCRACVTAATIAIAGVGRGVTITPGMVAEVRGRPG